MDEILLNNVFKIIASLLMAMGIWILNSLKNETKEVKQDFKKTSDIISSNLSDMKDSVAELNVHIATLIEKDHNKHQRLNHHEKSLISLDNELTEFKETHNNKINDLHTKVTVIEEKVKDII